MKSKILSAISGYKDFVPSGLFIVAAISSLMLLTASCTKTTSNPNPNPPPAGGGGGGGGGNGSLSVTSISPANPYPEDEFTIIGTGFNTNKDLDTVEFGRLINGNFGAWHGGVPSDYASLCTVVSATATQLRVKAVNPFNVDFSSFNLTPTSIAVAQIRVGGKKVVTPIIPWKRLMMLNGIDDPEAHISYGRPSDSLVILGKGFNKTGLTVDINGVLLSNFKVDSTPYESKVTLRLPKSFFGVDALDENETFNKTLSVKNNDGKTLSKEFTFFKSPKMQIYSMSASQNSYSIGSGAAVKISIYGRNFKPDAVFTLTSNNGYQSIWNMPVTNYQDSLKFELGTGALPIGNYTLNLDRGTFWIGRVTFSVTN